MADLHDLLEKTSRTFALSIPRLPEPTRTEVGVAYLLFRIVDTFEDSATWGREKRVEALHAFCDLLDRPQAEETRRLAALWHDEVPIDHAGYQELLAEMAAVLEIFFSLRPAARELVREHTVRTARGMAEFVERTGEDGELVLRDLADLRDYCYVVAGIVGEMLTELFLLAAPELQGVAADLRRRSRSFGEALQLVNILKDAGFDATEGRSYLPPEVDLGEVFGLAEHALREAGEYVLTLQRSGCDRGLVGFNAMNLLLAFAAVERVRNGGSGSKISREEVRAVVAAMDEALERDQPVLSLP